MIEATKPLRLMIVDDVPQVRQGLRTALVLAASLSGAQVEIAGEAGNGSQAVDLVEGLHPDAVLMDLEMPVMDGFAAARQIKQTAPQVVVLVLSVHDTPDARERAAQSGVDGFIVKGAPVSEILQNLFDLFRRSSENGCI
jgi:DNA-binding NarL/FixJ family response regulator